MNTLSLTKSLINKRSVTPEDEGCQDLIAELLKTLDFDIEQKLFDDTTNMSAKRGKDGTLTVYAGHNDEGPSGNEEHR